MYRGFYGKVPQIKKINLRILSVLIRVKKRDAGNYRLRPWPKGVETPRRYKV